MNHDTLVDLLSLILGVLIGLLLGTLCSHIEYDREEYSIQELNSHRACAYEQCPEYVQERIAREHNNLYPPEYYTRYSKKWWSSYCTYLPNECKN